ncbi:30S ribosomal protein S8e [Candidatus Woesearchaeota archaeon]|nr:30S ribosomal protein S8e [Candidatus Woesearchaeota archaeon]
MAITHKGRLKKKATGGRYFPLKGKRLGELGSAPTLTKIGEQKTKTVRANGGSHKTRMQVAKVANILDPKTKKHTKAEIKNVEECAANRHFVRRNVLVKGAVINTSAGKARVTSRPGQDGTVNAVLIA